MVEISTSILSVEPEKALKTFYDLEVAHTDYFHIDVMDGKFVEADTQKRMLENAMNLKQISTIPLDVHLMVTDVKEQIEAYLPFVPNIITFHYEAVETKQEIYDIINKIKENGIRVGIAIKPETKIEEIYEFLPFLHMILIMTVEPGKGGQKLIPETISKIEQVKEYLQNNKLEVDIQADGGIGIQNLHELVQKGLDIAVVGNGILSTQDYVKTIKELKEN